MDKDTNKNIKDIRQDLVKDASLVPSLLVAKRTNWNLFLSRISKLITALYMVTDIIDREEPIRQKLRTLGTELVSDTDADMEVVGGKITAILSLLNVAGAMSFISEMNCGILRKEFSELSKLVKENRETKPDWLEGFLETSDNFKDTDSLYKGQQLSKGHTRIGVQKGSTLMGALSAKTNLLSSNNFYSGTANKSRNRQNFDILKDKRRNDIIGIIKSSGGNMTIKDIKAKMVTGLPDTPNYGEKTLQRELLSMTKEGILNRTGEKRWSKYSLK